jgi:transposase
MAEIKVYTEQVNDVPLLVHQQRRMGIPDVLDEIIQPHGNHKGLSVGWLATLWQTFLLSEADHRMSEVEPWAAGQLGLLSALSPQPVTAKDFADDRLADVLRYLGQDTLWEEIEVALGQRLIRVYDLRCDQARLDSTAVAVYHDPESGTLFRHGKSKDHRPDLAQFKVMLATLDPLGMPLATLVVPGDRADDPLYRPAFLRARQVVGQGGRLYIGDSKMAARGIRALLQAEGDFYLTPLPQTGEVPALLQRLLRAVWNRKQPLEVVRREDDEEEEEAEGASSPKEAKVLALGYETSRRQKARVGGQQVTWTERVWVVFSPSLARSGRHGLEQRLQRAEAELASLTRPRKRGQRQWGELAPLQEAVQSILRRRRVEGLLEVRYEQEVERTAVRSYRDRPARVEERRRYVTQVRRNEAAIRQVRRGLGWRLYATNAPSERLALATGIRAYRGAPQIDRNFGRLKGRPLGIRPLYVQREDHVRGLARLLSLALRVLTLTEYVVREKLLKQKAALAGLYAGNPKRETARPTTERLLKAFRRVVLTVVRLPDQTIRHVTPLTDLQRRILELLDLPVTIYEDLAALAMPNPP